MNSCHKQDFIVLLSCMLIQVHVELLPSSGKVNNDTNFDSSLETVASGSDVELEEQKVESVFGPGAENKNKLRIDDGLDPPLLQMLLMIPDGFGLTLPSSQEDASKEVPPNPYLICKIFCCLPYPKTQPIWSSTNPTFSFRQTFPLRLSKSLLLKMCNSFMIVEVWHKTAGNVPDIVSIPYQKKYSLCEQSNLLCIMWRYVSASYTRPGRQMVDGTLI